MNNWKKVVVGGVAIAFLLILFQRAFRIDSKLFQMTILVLSVVALIVIFIYSRVRHTNETKRIQRQGQMLEEGKPEEALKDMELMVQELDQKGSKEQADRCRLNMTAALHDMKDFQRELEILESFHGDEFQDLANVIYRLNLCAVHFYLGDDDKGMQLYEENRALFTEYDQHKRYGGTIAAVLIFYKIAQGKYEQAQGLLDQAKLVWTARRFQADFEMAGDRLAAIPEEEKNAALPEAAAEE